MSQLAILLGRRPLVLPPGIVTVHLSDTEPLPKPAPAPVPKKKAAKAWDHMLAKKEQNLEKVIAAISKGKRSQRNIATHAGLSRSGVCILIKELESKGLVVCIGDASGKEYFISKNLGEATNA